MTVEHARSLNDQSVNWRKSSRSHANGCVEVGSALGVVGVRDSKLGSTSPVLAFGIGSWAAFTGRLRDGCFDH